MNRRRTLSLKKETLAELASNDLREVAGGASAGPTCYTCLTLCGVCEVTGVICPAELTGAICPHITLAAVRCPAV